MREWFKARQWGSPIRPSLALLTAGLGVLAVLVWRAALDAPDGRLHLTVLPVEGGEALLIQSPTGRAVLVDGGSSARTLSDALGRRLPLFHRELDYLVVALPQEGNLAALPRAIGRFPPSAVLWAGPNNASFSGRELNAALVEAQIPVTRAEAGQALDLGGGAQLRVLSANRMGAVLCLEWGNFRAVLPVGANFEDLEMLENRGYGPVSALLLAQGGYASLNPPELVQALRPQVVLLSVSAGNRDGLPDPETLEVVEGYPLLRTDLNGWLRLSTDGKQMWVEVEKK